MLERFLERRDEVAEAAFAALVERHGAMVLRVCRQILRDETDAEDAAQAAFLVLARRARSISRRESVASWLHGVALRVAAKARTAAMRRRAHEQRGGAMRSADHALDPGLEAIEDHEDWAKVHNELGALPRTFREPLILCYLDGLTQKQAADQLRCPLGTIQSRLARGRAKLKARLEKRGFGLGAAFAGESHAALQACPAPPAWSEATVRLAMQFAQGNGRTIAGAASALLAEEVVRGIVLTKMKAAAATILVSAILVTGAAAWGLRERNDQRPVVARVGSLPVLKPASEPAQEKAPPPPDWVTRTIRGIVRDERGRPMAKAWVGQEVARMHDRWEAIFPPDRVRVRKEPFRDEKGAVVAPGSLGKYFEVRDEKGIWQPVHPADIRSAHRSDTRTPFDPPTPPLAKLNAVFELRVGRDRWEMRAFTSNRSGPADRTNSQGQFFCEFGMSPKYGADVVHFASPDFSRAAISVVRYDDPDRLLEITLRKVRRVRARVVETPQDHPEQDLRWNVFTIDPGVGKLEDIAVIDDKGAHWQTGFSSDLDARTPGQRRFEADLPPGRYSVWFASDSVRRSIPMTVPMGDGPLDLPDFRVESMPWFKMLGKLAAEIDAVDLSGRPVRLADFRGKTVILSFWSTALETDSPTLPHLTQLRDRFKGKPLVILALHDASITSLARFNDAVTPFLAQSKGEPPVHFLLDRPPLRHRTGLFAGNAGEQGSGRTRDTYEGALAVCVIDAQGNLVSATEENLDRATTFSIGEGGQLVYDSGEVSSDGLKFDRDFAFALIRRSLEDQFKMVRSPVPQSKPDDTRLARSTKLTEFRGKVIDLEGKPIAGAKISAQVSYGETTAVTTGANGEFVFRTPDPTTFASVTVEASGFAARACHLSVSVDDYDRAADLRGRFTSVDRTGRITDPLILGPGVDVVGRVVRNGKPVAGLLIGLKYVDIDLDPALRKRRTTITDANGDFRLSHILAETEFWVYAKIGSVPGDGAVIPLRIQTAEDGITTDVGEIHVESGRTLAGRVVCSDTKLVPDGIGVDVSCPYADEGPFSKLDSTGRFEFKAIPAGPVFIHVVPTDKRSPSYRLSAKNKCKNPHINRLEGQLDRDISDLTILIEPGDYFDRHLNVDPALLADFNDAKAGPITGVAPRP